MIIPMPITAVVELNSYFAPLPSGCLVWGQDPPDMS